MLRKRWYAAIIVACILIGEASAQTFTVRKRTKNIPGRRSIVFDERLAALRSRPDAKALLLSRLHRGREVGLIGPVRDSYCAVAVSRNIRGWILREALLLPGVAADGEKLVRLIEATRDEYARARLARLGVDYFGGTPVAPRALLAIGEAAEAAAVKLTRDAGRRIGETGEEPISHVMNYVGLDRYNKLGITFDFDELENRYVYDGAAYREILKRYPRSPEAARLREQEAERGLR